MSTSSDTKGRQVKAGDTVRLVCDVVPGLEKENIPTKGMLVTVSDVYEFGTIHVKKVWKKADGTVYGYGGSEVVMAFEDHEWEVPAEDDFKPPTTRQLNAATKRLLELAEELNGRNSV